MMLPTTQKQKQTLLSSFLAVFFLFTTLTLPLQSSAEAPATTQVAATTSYTLTDVVYENAYGSITYPAFFGSGDPQIDMAVNAAIFSEGKIDEKVAILNALTEDGWGLEMTYDYYLKGPILSILLDVKGDMGKGQYGQQYSPITYNLSTGKAITPEEVFSDVSGASSYMEEILEAELYPTLSGYMTNDALTPIPLNHFTIDDWGITFYYPSKDFSYLSGISGSVHFLFSELESYLNFKKESPLLSLDIKEQLRLSEENVQSIRQAVTTGAFPFLPVPIGVPLPQVIDAYRLLSDPDLFPSGRFIHIEDPLFRDIWLITDSLHQDFANSIVQGIRTTRGNLFGLIVGKTTQKEWQKALGEPDSSIVLDKDAAYDYWLEPGTSDYYRFGNHQLRLHSDEKGVLSCMMILQ
ncbi:MAG: hypothetical protein GX786_11130 [Clostridiales bacterium]|nr:hypothetical protein [Clostridiales bacterium]